ncbi:MAG: penicillin acylase family protein [Deltaproteobacteria bacterium]|nr:penicillin acylase family protein [Candidatus Zymogenaceae bacterium]
MRIFKILVIAVSAVIVLAAGGIWIYLNAIVPKYEGELSLPGIREGAVVIRDVYGVPHIYADNINDLYFALGYCQAQDRLFQMDFYRRAARGRLSEVFGKDLLDADRYLVTMGFARTAKEQIDNLPPALREMVEAFSAGINASMERNPLPAECKILGYRPDPWTVEDSQAIGNLISFQLAGWAYKNEILNWLLLDKLGPERAALFLPFLPKETVFITARTGPAYDVPEVSDESRRFLSFFINRTLASNNWVVSGEKSVTGNPILCEDSHESGPEMPTQWHLSHLVGPDIDIAGAMFPGAPIFVFGHNDHIAWGVTNFTLDTQDLYLEKINPENENQVMYEGKWVDMELITEAIPVKGDNGVTQENITVRITPHGPIINDVESGLGETPVSLRAQGFEPWPLLEAFYRINTARNWDEFTAGLSIYAAGPQHFVYADSAGTIGYVGAGKCPIRTNSTGLLPKPGWDGKSEWRGYYPFESMPIMKNPEKGYIGTANNPPISGESPIFLSDYWESPWRAARIDELLRAKERLSTADMKEMQLDVKSGLAARLVPIIVETLRRDATDKLAPYIDALAAWDYRSLPDSPGAAIFEVTFNELLIETFSDELGDDLFSLFMDDKSVATNTLCRLVTDDRTSDLFDNTATEKRETFDDTLMKAFGEAIIYLSDTLGNDPAAWHWGAFHTVEFSHVFGQVKILRPFFNYGPFPFGGSDLSLNRGGYNKSKPYAVDITASIRYIVDLADLKDSLVVLSTGQCQSLTSPHREDMTDLFLTGNYIPWYFDKKDIEENAEGIMKFLPEK